MTVSEYLDEWLKRGIEGKKAARTLEIYRFCCTRIVAELGKVKLEKLAPHQVERLTQKLAKQMGSSSVHSVHRTFRAALNRAVKWGYIKEPPMKRSDTPLCE